MSQMIFYSRLNEFSRKYLVTNHPVSLPDQLLFAPQLESIKREIFEHLLLFDGISFKVHGENIPLAMLLNVFGENTFRSLVEQGALRFVLWNPFVAHLVQNIPGVDALVHGNLNSPAHSDPEKSIELGLDWMTKKPTSREKKKLVKLLLPTYTVPAASLSGQSVSTVKSAFYSGRLSHYGLDPERDKFDSLSTAQKKTLGICAEEFVEYNFMLDNNLTSFCEYKYYSPFWNTVKKFSTPVKMQNGFGSIATIEGFPNIDSIYSALRDPLPRIHTIRKNRNATRFRNWLESAVSDNPDREIVKTYVDSISERKGLFESAPRKFTKTIALAMLGAGSGLALGELAGGPLGAAIGTIGGGFVSQTAPVVAQKLIEMSAELGVDLLDTFALDRVAKGWSPRMFFNDLEKLSRVNQLK